MALRRGWMEDEAVPWASEDDAALALRARADRAAFGILYDRHVDRVYGYCHRRLGTRAAAEDATSQTFLKALAAIASYRPETASFRAWLLTIASRVVIDAYRSRRPTTALDAAGDVRSPETGPEGVALAAETRREVTALLARLPDEQAHLVHLRLAGLTDREIAAVLGKSHGAVRVAQHRALKRLRELAPRELASRDLAGDGPATTGDPIASHPMTLDPTPRRTTETDR